MDIFVKRFYTWTLVLLVFLCGSSSLALDLSPDEVGEIIKISKSIALAKPNLSDSKKLEYAVGIFKASKKFGISSNLLIAIAAQETSFREDLPEGKAGEFGIVQIRKIWMVNPKLRKQFKDANKKDLLKPEKAFMYAAWILKDLKDTAPKSSIPFWSFYNARGFQPRFRYFLSVNQKLAYLNKGIPFTKDVADNVQFNGSAERNYWQPDVRLLAVVPQVPIDIPSAKGFENTSTQSNLVTTASLGSDVTIDSNGWIKQALKRLEKDSTKQKKENLTVPLSRQSKGGKARSLAYSKTAARLLKSIPD